MNRSQRRRAKRAHRGHPHIHHAHSVKDSTFGVQCAAVRDRDDEAAIELAKKRTHDNVVEMLGDRRASGISWTFHDPGEDASAVLAALENPTDAQAIEDLRKFLDDNPRALLVVATAEEVPNARCRKCGSRDVWRNRKGTLLCRKCGRPVLRK